jgi:hypothetical protein
MSKAFAIGGTARIEPFVGWSMLFMSARSGVIDATPACDAYQSFNTAPAGMPPDGCAAASNEDMIVRQRWFGGFKLRLSVLFVAGQLEIIPAGTSRDGATGAADRSSTQQTYSLATGFDF